jgi:hypothetical protein
MCEHMMWGQTYGGSSGVPLVMLGTFLSFVLLAVLIWPMAHWLRGKAMLGTFQEPQPRDEPYTGFEFSGSALETSQEGHARDSIDLFSSEHAELAPGNSVHDDELQNMYRPVNNHGATRSGESRDV